MKKNTVRTEDAPAYAVAPAQQGSDDDTIAAALNILRSRLRKPGAVMASPADTMNYLTLRLAHLEHESFCVLYLDQRHRVIELEEMFRGTINQATVYPREIAKGALLRNAAAVILAHNHPSGHPEPSEADRLITTRLRAALDLVDIRLLDHVIVGHDRCTSMANLNQI